MVWPACAIIASETAGNAARSSTRVVVEALGPVGREGNAHSGAPRRVAARAEAHDLGKIIGAAGGGESSEHRKIKLGLGSGKTATDVRPGGVRPPRCSLDHS